MTHYILAILAIIIAVILIKKFVSCMVRIIIFAALLATLAAIYFMYFT